MQLPASAQEIADVIGRAATLSLIGQLPRCIAGKVRKKSSRVIMYVPKRIGLDHPLVKMIGWVDASKLVKAFGGEIMRPANCAEIHRGFRDQAILQMLADGMKPALVAAAVGISERQVRNIIRENPPEELPGDKRDDLDTLNPGTAKCKKITRSAAINDRAKPAAPAQRVRYQRDDDADD
jgi:hypothetical protein